MRKLIIALVLAGCGGGDDGPEIPADPTVATYALTSTVDETCAGFPGTYSGDFVLAGVGSPVVHPLGWVCDDLDVATAPEFTHGFDCDSLQGNGDYLSFGLVLSDPLSVTGEAIAVDTSAMTVCGHYTITGSVK